MAETTPNEGAELVGAARDRGMEQLEGAKGQLADGAERVASAVDRTADALAEDGDNAISGFGHSVASLMRQLAGGLRERDIDDFARELADLARRNPGVFLAGSVALGFGIARFFKARVPQSSSGHRGESWQSSGGWQDSAHGRSAYDTEEDLDLSAGSTQRRDTQGDSGSQTGTTSQTRDASQAERDDQQNERNASKSRQSSKHKGKPQRASSVGSQYQSPSAEPTSTDTKTPGTTPGSTESAVTGGTGGGAPRGGKS